jgi:tetratricopeptide (TPR) repeat protein
VLQDSESAQTHFKDAIEVFQQLLGKKPNDLEITLKLAMSHRALGQLLGKAGKDSAIVHFEKSRAYLRQLAVDSYQIESAKLDIAFGEFRFDKDRSESLAAFRKAEETLSPLIDKGDPDAPKILKAAKAARSRLESRQN